MEQPASESLPQRLSMSSYFEYATLNKTLLAEEGCGYCVRCKTTFTYDKIDEWCRDLNGDGEYKYETALCVGCGIDTVIPRNYALKKEISKTGLSEKQILEDWHYKANN